MMLPTQRLVCLFTVVIHKELKPRLEYIGVVKQMKKRKLKRRMIKMTKIQTESGNAVLMEETDVKRMRNVVA